MNNKRYISPHNEWNKSCKAVMALRCIPMRELVKSIGYLYNDEVLIMSDIYKMLLSLKTIIVHKPVINIFYKFNSHFQTKMEIVDNLNCDNIVAIFLLSQNINYTK